MEEEEPPISITELVQLMVVSLRREGGSPKTWPMSPESAMVGPPPPEDSNGAPTGDTARIAIKSGDSLLVLKVTDGWETLAKCEVHRVQYWTWLNYSLLALVTDRCVYHWNIDQGGIPDKVFTRHQRLAFTEIVGYKADSDLRWFALTGLAPQEDSISGLTQLYSVDNRLTQCISAHVVTFVKYKFEDNKHSSTVLCVACRDAGHQAYGKVHVIELGPQSLGNLALTSHFDNIKFVEDEERYDFPVSLEVSLKLGLLYMVTKYGQMYVCDLETASCLFACCISTNIIFTTTLNTTTQGILGISRSGQVLAIDLKLERLADYVRQVARKTTPADRLAHVTGVTVLPHTSTMTAEASGSSVSMMSATYAAGDGPLGPNGTTNQLGSTTSGIGQGMPEAITGLCCHLSPQELTPEQSSTERPLSTSPLDKVT